MSLQSLGRLLGIGRSMRPQVYMQEAHILDRKSVCEELGLGTSATYPPLKCYQTCQPVLNGVSIQETRFNKDVISRCETIFQEYKVKPWLWSGHVETIFASRFRRSPNLEYNRECLIMPDGGTVAVDFEPPAFDKGLPKSAPVLILLPGLTGGSHDSYVEYCVIAARLIGIRAIVFNGRGTSDGPATTPQFYSASFTGDMKGVVKRIREWYPDSILFAAGWSLGANILLKYLGEVGSKTPLKAAVSLCNPFDLVICDDNFHKGFNRIYDISLALSLRRLFIKYEDQFRGLEPPWNPQLAKRCWSIREFDDAITRVCFDWPSVDAYYEGSGSTHSIPDIQIPLLCIQAMDDPIAVERAIPYKKLQENQNCILVVTPAGGHLGWVSGPAAPFGGPWTDQPVMEFFKSMLHQLEAGQPSGALINSISEVAKS